MNLRITGELTWNDFLPYLSIFNRFQIRSIGVVCIGMRLKWIYVRALCLVALVIFMVYGVFFLGAPVIRSWNLQKNAMRLIATPKRLYGLHESSIPEDVLDDENVVDETTGKKSISSGDVLWVIPARRQAWALDLVLQSLKGFENVLVSIATDVDGLESVTEKYGIGSIRYPHTCYRKARTQKSSNTDSSEEECQKNHWWWTLQKSWERNPEVVCITEDDVIIHPDAMKLLSNRPYQNIAGVRLTAKKAFEAPWCFDRGVWNQMKDASVMFCMSEYTDWASAIVSYVTKEELTLPAKYHVPFVDMALKITDCESDAVGLNCTDALSKKIQTWSETKRDNAKAIKMGWAPPRSKPNRRRKMPADHAHCMGLCKGFQFFPDKHDQRIYVNRMQNDVNAYMIDLGPVCIDPSKLQISKGGEEIKDVIGRKEEDEFAQYEVGAWKILGSVPNIHTRHYQNDLLGSVAVTDKIPRADVKGTTIAFQRNEYANLWHNTMDLFNLYLTLQHIPAKKLLWLDGHAVGNLDDMWTRPFGVDVQRLGHLNGTTCFERLVLMPKENPIYDIDKFGDCTVNAFVHRILDAYGVKEATDKHDTVIVRGFYLAHPRQSHKVERGFTEEQLEQLERRIPHAKFVRFHELSLSQQLQTIVNTRTLYAIHGAGCTFGFFLRPGSKLVEWVVPSRQGVTMFVHMMTWRPDVDYQRIDFDHWLSIG